MFWSRWSRILFCRKCRDPKQWWGGHIWIDNAKRYVYNFVAYQTVSLWSNPNEYKPAEFKSFDDLLNPKLQGRIGISDPRTPGSGSSMWSYMNYIKGEEYLKKLVGQKFFVTRDLRLLAENLARGKIAVTSGIGYSEFQPFIKANLPVVPLPVPKEGLYASGGYGHLVILKNHRIPTRRGYSSTGSWAATARKFSPAAWASARRRLDIDTKWLKEYGVIAAKDGLTLEQFYKIGKSVGRENIQDSRTRRGDRAQAAGCVGGNGLLRRLSSMADEICATGSTISTSAANSSASAPKSTGTRRLARSPAKCRASGPALLFENITDQKIRFCRRLFTNGTGTASAFAVSRRARNDDVSRDGADFQRSVFRPLKPVTVTKGPVKENKFAGDEIDLIKFPCRNGTRSTAAATS